MPAHLEDPKNAAKRAKFLAAEGTEEHIAGNNGADALAGAGALRYPMPPLLAFLAQQRKRLTMTAQDMYSTIWMQYVEDNTKDGVLMTASDDDITDIAELDHQDEGEYESDNEPLVDLDGNEITRAPQVATPQLSDNDVNILSHLHPEYAKMPLLVSTP